ncbi:MFS transporter [Pollutimonas harenae]|uniref:MFS transporter n=1 Tax=Pollutimonas harenae TaxID=657015 RepID=A0A853GVE8_9BURK|nr:MFS transporter [Pollutimonas harenae]NYT84756.1 MFS transporter [Pollutimonas harenae]TEA72843.1 MFS transporter [Pollutimonas harenae]
MADAAKVSSAELTDGLDAPRRHWAAATLLLALTIAVLDATMSNVALPAIAQALSINPGDVVWVVIAYNLVVVVSLLPLSAVAERVGFRRMFAAGMTLFMLASLGSAASVSLTTLILSRMAQGLGSAMLMCLFGGLVRNIYPLNKLGMGLSLNAMTVGLMSVAGPTLGAFILQLASWHWIFLITLPLCLIAYFGIRYLPDIPRNRGRFDWLACALSIPVFGLSIIGLDALVEHPLQAVLCLLLAALAAWVLVRRSRDQTAPIVPIDLLRITPIAYAVGASAFSFAAQMSAFVALPFYARQVLGYSYAEVGMLLGAWSVGVAVMAPVAGYLSNRYAVAVLCGIGASGIALGMLWLILLPVNAAFLWFTLSMLLGGVGFGFFQTPNNRALLAGSPRHRSGAAGGMQATTRVFGQSFGTTLVGLSFNLSATHGARLGVIAAIACALVAVLINVLRHMNPMADLEL